MIEALTVACLNVRKRGMGGIWVCVGIIVIVTLHQSVYQHSVARSTGLGSGSSGMVLRVFLLFSRQAGYRTHHC